ncbi:MAG: START domain-containing protein [Bacteroidia bacterium]
MKQHFFFLLFLFSMPILFAQKWVYQKEAKGVKGYTASSDGIFRLKLVTTINGTLTACSGTMADVPNFNKWNTNVISSKILKKLDTYNFHIYATMDMPWPVSDRDIVFHSTFSQDEKTKIVRYKTVCKPDLHPAQANFTRIKTYTTNIAFIPLDGKRTQMEYIITLSDKDGIPIWVVENLGSSDYFEHIANFRKLVETTNKGKVDERVKNF